MSTIRHSLLVLGLLLSAQTLAVCADSESGDDKSNKGPKKPKRKFTIGKATTYITGPLDKDDYIDYAKALNERMGKGVTPANNANVLIWKALGPRPEGEKETPGEYFKWMGMQPPPEKGDYFIGFSRYRKEHLKIEKGEIGEDVDKRPWRQKDYPALASWLKVNEKPLAVLVEASKRPQYFNPLVPPKTDLVSSGLIAVMPPALQTCRDSADALATRAMLRLGEGAYDDAWKDLIACHRLGRLVARGSTLLECVLGIAIDAGAARADVAFLERATLNAKQIERCLSDLRTLPPIPEPADKVDVEERFKFLEHMTLIARHGSKYFEGASAKPNPAIEHILDDVDWDPALRSVNGWYDRLVAALRAKDRASKESGIEQIAADLKALKKEIAESEGPALLYVEKKKDKGYVLGRVLISLVVRFAGKVQMAADRSRQAQDNLAVAFALAWHKVDKGSYPKTLDELAPKYLKNIPHDIFSGKALIYRPSEKGYLLYSVGPNGKDEEGRGPNDEPPGDDVSVRMAQSEARKK